jgi:ParB/RepB/Spo0J family partition protein
MELELDMLSLRYERLRRLEPRREKRLLASLAEVGQQFPILVVEAEETFVVIDGYKRVRALRKLGREIVRAARWELSEPEAVMVEGLLRSSGGDGPLEEAWRLEELRTRFGLSCSELARRFDKSASWISRRLALVNVLPDVVQEHVRRGEIAAYGAMKYLGPLARANRSDCAAIAKGIASLSATTRQMRELYVAYTEAAPALRERIVKNPGLFLRAVADPAPPEVEKSAGKVLFEDLGQLGGVARRLHRRLREGLARRVRPQEKDDMARCATQAGTDAAEAIERLRKDLEDAGRGDESGDSETV